ncbi:right-handed parallel beta-helix repeat-containing protein [Methanobrevibacter sp.]|uniref:right-handed parallel beta-helix repeat-containing protein n=1 Tax=Methanobrevibacter sp. TaxID=66852 RepID=UPI00388D5476
MIKKINILMLLLLVLLSISAVSAVDDSNISIDSNNTVSDVLTISDADDVLSENSHTVTQDTYGMYFDINGNLIKSTVNEGDTIYLDGSFSDLKFTIDKKLSIVGTSSNNMKNSMITVLNGASGSYIANLNIANTKAQTYGVFLNTASNCKVENCSISNSGQASYCICLANNANYNEVLNNDLTCYGVTYGHGTRSTPPLILSGSHYNYVANNHVEADDANGIYLSSYSGGPLNGGPSNFNTIFNNTVHYNVLPTSWSYGIQIMGGNNTIKSNKVIGAYRGVSTAGSGNIIIENTIINLTGADYNHLGVETGGEFAIVGSYDSIVVNNTVIGAKVISTGAGITAIDGSIVEDNWVNVTLKGRGIVAGGSDVIIKSNVVFTESGSGIYEKDEGSGLLIESNNITSNTGVGILIEKLSSKRMPSYVTIVNNIISTNNPYAIDASGVQADTSVIDPDSNTIIGKGLINSPAGVIDTSKPTYTYKGVTHIITPENIREYINDNGGLTSKINDSDILSFEGSFNNEVIYITKGVKITGNNPIFYNSTFKVTTGNVLIENLTIINNEAERVNAWGILVNQASGVRITNNNIAVNDPKAAYAIYVLESSDIDVFDNILTSQGDYLTFTLLSYACEDCVFSNNTIYTVGTGQVYKFSPEKCIDGNELVINGRSYCLDGNELTIDGNTYCLDGNELVINGISYCLDGNELVIDGTRYCIDGNEFVIDGTRYCIDGNELTIDGTSYCFDGNELTIDGKTYCLDGNELTINGKSYCLDGNELTIDGKTYCLDGNELVIDGTRYCVDGNEYCMDGGHIVSEIYQTYGILLLYSSNNVISGNDVNVTSDLNSTYQVTGANSSTNSIVGIDLYFNCHNNVFSQNTVNIKAYDNYLYGMGVLGYYTGHSAPEGQGATNNQYVENIINIEGSYFATGIIIGDESEGTILKDNIINAKASVTYGITLEMSQESIIDNNTVELESEVVYGIQGYQSNKNEITGNVFNANAKYVYGMVLSNGNYNEISYNTINANGRGGNLTIKNLDSLGYGNAGIYLHADSCNNTISGNEIRSSKGHAILMDEVAIENIISDNYLDSENGIGNNAINGSTINQMPDNYKYIVNATAGETSVVYMGIGEFRLAFDGNVDGAIVELYDINDKFLNKTTVSNGVATIKYQLDESYIPAQYKFYAKFIKKDYKASIFEIKTKINKASILIDLNDAKGAQGTSVDIIAKVTDEFGNIKEGVIVQFNRITSAGRSAPIGTGVTNKEGIATISYAIQASLSEGVHNITAEVSGLDYYNDAVGNSNLTVLTAAIPSIVGAKDYSVYYGNTVNYKVRVMEGEKSVGAGREVKFTINGVTKTVKTDANGYATYAVKLGVGTYVITADYNGLKVSKKITFKPTLTAKNVVGKKSKTTSFNVKLVNMNGKILKNKKITFKIKNKKYTANTNSQGVAKLSIKISKVGKYTVASSYGGCTIKNTITIKN